MINIFEVNETNAMIEKENLDVRTITMGISLIDCMTDDLDKLRDNIYKKITDKAKDLVITGKEIEKLLDEAHITANKNTVPNDPQKPFVTSGIRLGTPAVTSRGMNTEDMDRIAEAISIVVKEGSAGVEKARAIVEELTKKYPLI